MELKFPDPSNIMQFEVLIRPDEGMYRGGTFRFRVNVNENYPHDPPKVKCVQKVYHPNLDLDGNVCLNILREEWNPILNLNSVMAGLLFLFLDPNADDPLNKGKCCSGMANVCRSGRRLAAEQDDIRSECQPHARWWRIQRCQV